MRVPFYQLPDRRYHRRPELVSWIGKWCHTFGPGILPQQSRFLCRVSLNFLGSVHDEPLHTFLSPSEGLHVSIIKEGFYAAAHLRCHDNHTSRNAYCVGIRLVDRSGAPVSHSPPPTSTRRDLRDVCGGTIEVASANGCSWLHEPSLQSAQASWARLNAAICR